MNLTWKPYTQFPFSEGYAGYPFPSNCLKFAEYQLVGIMVRSHHFEFVLQPPITFYVNPPQKARIGGPLFLIDKEYEGVKRKPFEGVTNQTIQFLKRVNLHGLELIRN